MWNRIKTKWYSLDKATRDNARMVGYAVAMIMIVHCIINH